MTFVLSCCTIFDSSKQVRGFGTSTPASHLYTNVNHPHQRILPFIFQTNQLEKPQTMSPLRPNTDAQYSVWTKTAKGRGPKIPCHGSHSYMIKQTIDCKVSDSVRPLHLKQFLYLKPYCLSLQVYPKTQHFSCPIYKSTSSVSRIKQQATIS